MNFGPRKNRELGSMRPETLRRLQLLVERDLQRADELDALRKVAQAYLSRTREHGLFRHFGDRL
jgi:hypothetical protein